MFLGAEGAAAAAGALDVGVIELEAGAFDGFDVVDLDAIEVHGTHLIDGDLQAVEIENLIGVAGRVLKRHMVLEAGAATTNDRDAKGRGRGVLHPHDFFDFRCRCGR